MHGKLSDQHCVSKNGQHEDVVGQSPLHHTFASGCTGFWLQLRKIWNPAIFSEIQPSPTPAKFIARFGGCLCGCSTFSYVTHWSSHDSQNIWHAVKHHIFMCPLFREFRDLGKFVKIMGREYANSNLVYHITSSSASKNTNNFIALSAKINGSQN